MSHDAPPPRPTRADELLLAQGKADSRTAAQRLIRTGKVTLADGSPVAKPSQKVPDNVELCVSEPLRFVSQGGEKLEAWFTQFPLDITGWHALDIGASTGGFIDCLLQRGAEHVTGIDVGHGQLHPRLVDEDRIYYKEGINAKALDETKLPYSDYPLVVADLSFISLTKVLTPIWNRVAPGGQLVLLVKPQFEAAREAVDRGRGVIRDEVDRLAALESVLASARELPDATITGQMECPVSGGEGNREYLVGLRKG
ncbi:MAG: TlyA family RNA methyltransferase [Puniceicoccales bacterium]